MSWPNGFRAAGGRPDRPHRLFGYVRNRRGPLPSEPAARAVRHRDRGRSRPGRRPGARAGSVPARLDDAAREVEIVDRLLRGGPGVQALIGQPDLVAAIEGRLTELDALAVLVDGELDTIADADLEEVHVALVRFKDALWAVRKDRLRTAVAVADLAGCDAPPSALAAFSAVQTVLSALDRLEVRGRDSAGIHLIVRDHGLDLDSEPVRQLLAGRTDDILYPSGAVRVADGHLTFVYKAAAEIGELGDNVRALRAALRTDALLHLAVASEAARVNVMAHTRWASVGIISEPNAHPVIQEEEGGSMGPYVAAALNGDVDNHADLKAAAQLHIPLLVTTDAKVIPALVSRAASGDGFVDAFRRTVGTFEGSVAVAAVCSTLPDVVALAVRGSGQGLYVGLADDSYIVASEPYGLVEETTRYLRLDGETPAQPGVEASRGQIVVLDAAVAGTVGGIRRLAYDGTELPVDEDEISTAEITTRDIDRGAVPALLVEGDQRGTGELRQDPARPDPPPRRTAPARGPERADVTGKPRREVGGGRDPADHRDRPGHGRGRRPERRRDVPPSAPRQRRFASRPPPPPSCRASAWDTICPTLWSSR